MAGGSFLSYNKVRPGAYINFEAVPKSAMNVGDRGIATIALPLSWGPENELIEVLSSDMLDGASKSKIGFTAFDAEAKLLSAMLSYCYKALVYNTNTGGATATATVGANLTATAKYKGTFGNKIKIAVEQLKDKSGLFNVITYVDGAVVDSQKVKEIAELEPNDYVTFSGSEALEANAGTPLTSGTDGTTNEKEAYPKYFELLKMAKWQTLAIPTEDETVRPLAVTFIEGLREDEGRYVQAVICNYDADYEGIINSVSGVVVDGVKFEPKEFTAIVAGMTAGANINESNTSKVIRGATQITNEMTDAKIKEGLNNGQFIISTSASGKIKVEKDINSLHTFTQKKNYNFSKNRVIRTLDEIGTTISMTWGDSYSGKIDNNSVGRDMFKADIIGYGSELSRISAIQEFNGAEDISVAQGKDLDTVIVEWNVKPVDSMERLYMTVKVQG